MCPPPSAAPEFQLSLVDDPLLRLQRLLRIAPQQGLGVVRRAVLLALLAWLPVAVWALLNRRWLASVPGEPLLSHFGVHVRCLVGIPLLVLADAPLSGLLGRIFPHFARSGLVSEAEQPRFAAILKSAARWRDSWITWSAIAGLTVASVLTGNATADKLDALNWAIEGGRSASEVFGTCTWRGPGRDLTVSGCGASSCWPGPSPPRRLDLQLVPAIPTGSAG